MSQVKKYHFQSKKKSTKGYYLETGERFSIEIPLCKCAPPSLNVRFQYTFRYIIPPEIFNDENLNVERKKCTLFGVCSVCIGSTNAIAGGP